MTNAELIQNMAKAGIIKSDRVVAVMKCIDYSEEIVLKTHVQAMSKVNRSHYVHHPSTAYEDSPQYVLLSHTLRKIY